MVVKVRTNFETKNIGEDDLKKFHIGKAEVMHVTSTAPH